MGRFSYNTKEARGPIVGVNSKKRRVPGAAIKAYPKKIVTP